MEISTELMKHILAKTTNPEDVSEELQKYNSISREIMSIRKSKNKLVEDFQYNQKTLDSQLDSVRKKCHHPVFSFNSGPCSGDSFHECDICGGTW